MESGSVADLTAKRLDAAGVPRPDGSPIGDAVHVLGVLAEFPDDHCVVAVTKGVYGPGRVTGLSLGDLRRLVTLAQLGDQVRLLTSRRP